MISKLRESMLILIITNTISIILVVIAPMLYGAITNQMTTGINNQTIVSLPMILSYIICVVLVSIIFTLHRSRPVRDIVINNSITPADPCYTNIDKADEVRKLYLDKQRDYEKSIFNAVKEYTYAVLSPYMSDDNLEILIQNIRIYEIPDSCIIPVKTNGQLNTLDIRHYAWNIGERLGWSGQKRASFIKLCFPSELHDVEMESIRRTLRQKGKCTIEIDIPCKDDYMFHYNDKQYEK